MGRRAARTGAALVGAALLVAGCSASGGDDAARPTTPEDRPERTTTTRERERGGPSGPVAFSCPDDDDVAEVVGHDDVDRSLSSGGAASNILSYQYEGCAYRFDDGDQKVKVEELSPTEGAEPGGSLFEALDSRATEEADDHRFVPVADLGDDAYLDGTRVVVKLDDALLVVEFQRGAEFELDKKSGASGKSIELTEAVLDADVPLWDASTEPDCEAVTEIIEGVLGDSADTISSSGRYGVNGVSLETTGCQVQMGDGEFGEETLALVGTAPVDQWDPWVQAKLDSGPREDYAPVTVEGHRAYDTGIELVVDDATEAERPFRITTEDVEGSPEELAQLRRELAQLVLAG